MSPKRFLNLEFLKLPTNRTIFQIDAKEIGLPPGTLVHVGERKELKPVISLIDYGQELFETRTDITVEDAAALKETPTVSWINLSGIHDINIIEQFGSNFGINPLALEDILNTQHRPKLEEFANYTLIILKMLLFNDKTQTIEAAQISMVLGSHYLLSFQEYEGDVFKGVHRRLEQSSGCIRQRGPDYLAYALIDTIVDSYFHILEEIGDKLVLIEERLLSDPDRKTLAQIHHYKKELLSLRKAVWPLREVVNNLLKNESSLISEDTQVFLRDLYDHTIQVLDTVEIFRDTVSGLQDLYMSSVSNRMNEIMKVLTIIASIFIPLTFIAGIYGMNFEYMPELKWHGGYFAVWMVMIGCVAGMLIYFKNKRWL
jgi:magnesium transporter